MSPLTLLLTLITLNPAPGAAPAYADNTDPDTHWRSLFNGRDLTGWHIAAKPADRDKPFWTVEDGAIVCDSLGRPDHDYVWLITDDEFSDFELQLKVRTFKQSPGNSGVQIRSRYDHDHAWLDGPQIDIHPPAPWRTGLIYDETRGHQRWIHPDLPNWKITRQQAPHRFTWNHADDDPQTWNHITIRCQGTHITTIVNGITISDYDGAGVLDDQHHRARNVGLRGHIALQLHSRDQLKIHFKDLRLRPLN